MVVVAGGALAFYLGTAHGKQAPVVTQHRHPVGSVKVVSVQTVGLIDFGPYDDNDTWQNDADDHPLALLLRGTSVDFVRVPSSEINSGTPEWTADQTSDGGDIFIYVPTGQCLTATAAGALRLAHCDLGKAQRWRPLHSMVALSEPIAQYANVATDTCLTAGRGPGKAALTSCGPARTKSQEIAFWWSA